MSSIKLILQSLRHYWRTNLAVLLGVIAGTAVIGGALIVGDSVRGSLRKMTHDRLGKIDHVLTGPRFFRQDMVEEVAGDAKFQARFGTAAPALVLTGGLEHREDASEEGRVQTASARRVGNVNIYGIDQRTWNLLDHGDVARPVAGDGNEPGGIVINERVADQLAVKPGQSVKLLIELPAAIPRDSLLGSRDETTVEIELKVSAILPESAKASRLNLSPNQQFPLNAFVALSGLQRSLGLAEKRTSKVVVLGTKRRRVTEVEPARINTVFFHAKDEEDAAEPQSVGAAEALTEIIRSKLTLEDLYLRIATPKELSPTHGYLSFESDQQVLPEEFGQAALDAAKKLGLQTSPVLVYLANSVEANKAIAVAAHGVSLPVGHAGLSGRLSRYPVIAGLDIGALTKPPFGPFEFTTPAGRAPRDNEIVITDWLAKDMQAKVGDKLHVTYHIVGAHVLAEDGKLPEEEITFTVAGIVRLSGTVADDQGLIPEVKGITDVQDFNDIKKPFPMKEVTPRDELFWNLARQYPTWARDARRRFQYLSAIVGSLPAMSYRERYRATPRAYVSLKTAKKLWRSRYGSLTSVRVARIDGKSIDESKTLFGNAALKELKPQQTGMVVRPVKFEGLQAADGTTDFSGLFLAFSFFLILSATILIGLLFRLGVERRGANIGLLGAVGFSPSQVQRMFLAEGLLVVILGGLLGSLAAWGYAELMVYGLRNWWIGAIGTKHLYVYITAKSLAIGFAASVIVATIAVWWALRYFRKLTNRELLAGATEPAETEASQLGRGRRSRLTALISGGIAGVLLIAALTGLVPDSEAFEGFSWQIVAFFMIGMALLVGVLAALAWWLNSDKSAAVSGGGLAGIGRLGMRNAARHRQRSVMTVALIASATFVIVAVAAGHRDPAVEAPVKSSGNGGFTLYARSSSPILHDLNTKAGREKLGFRLDEQIEQAKNRIDEAGGDPPSPPLGKGGNSKIAKSNKQLLATLQRRKALLEKMDVYAFRVKPGEDASCLNIYQTRVPTIFGVPDRLVERGGFKFVGAKVDNPWTLLNERHEPLDGLPVIPVLGDMNTLKYSLHKGVGQTIPVPNEENPQYHLKIVGMFDGSVFQGVLLMSDANFRQLYRDRVGYEYFLIEVPPDEADELETVLETGLRTYGFDSDRVSKKIAEFLAVQNTYLSTFQTLGGLGLLLGTLGLATVMLRNVLERRSELALLRAVGFRNSGLSWLVVIENALLLIWGLVAGTASALLAMTPHLLTTGGSLPWTTLSWMLAGVFTIGMVAALAAVREAVRTPIVATLRSE